jgi:hypothetical protein
VQAYLRRALVTGQAEPAQPKPTRSKPTVSDLGVDPDAQTWLRSGTGPGAVEVAFVEAHDERWVLTRVSGDGSGRVLVYDRHEWDCFLDGAKRGEFDGAASTGLDDADRLREAAGR